MSRIIFTEKSENYLKTLFDEYPSIDKKIDPRQEKCKQQIKTKLSSVFKQDTPQDEYQKKILDLALISKNFKAIQSFLIPKTLTDQLPSYMKKKIDHITKLIVNTNKEENSINILNDPKISAISFKKPQTAKKENNNSIQIKCNVLLYSENYLERLMQKNRNYLEKNKKINLHLDKLCHSNNNTPNSLKEKKEKENEIMNIFNEKKDMLDLKTKYMIRFRSRLGEYHKKKYIKLWKNNNLPTIGLMDNIEIARNKRKEIKNNKGLI